MHQPTTVQERVRTWHSAPCISRSIHGLTVHLDLMPLSVYFAAAVGIVYAAFSTLKRKHLNITCSFQTMHLSRPHSQQG